MMVHYCHMLDNRRQWIIDIYLRDHMPWKPEQSGRRSHFHLQSTKELFLDWKRYRTWYLHTYLYMVYTSLTHHLSLWSLDSSVKYQQSTESESISTCPVYVWEPANCGSLWLILWLCAMSLYSPVQFYHFCWASESHRAVSAPRSGSKYPNCGNILMKNVKTLLFCFAPSKTIGRYQIACVNTVN